MHGETFQTLSLCQRLKKKKEKKKKKKDEKNRIIFGLAAASFALACYLD